MGEVRVDLLERVQAPDARREGRRRALGRRCGVVTRRA